MSLPVFVHDGISFRRGLLYNSRRVGVVVVFVVVVVVVIIVVVIVTDTQILKNGLLFYALTDLVHIRWEVVLG